LPSFYRCKVCHAIFGNKEELNRHLLTHTIGGAKGGGEGCILNVKCQEGHAGGKNTALKVTVLAGVDAPYRLWCLRQVQTALVRVLLLAFCL
jgi:hypothetical protein